LCTENARRKGGASPARRLAAISRGSVNGNAGDDQGTETGASWSELVARAQHLTREQFIQERRAPVLLVLGEANLLEAKGVAKTASGFKTMIPGVTTASNTPRPLQVFELAKRPGANAFSHMITVGRAHNNDVVIPDAAVSKFHLSFTQREGVWNVTDSSTHGTWIGATKLEKGLGTRIESGVTLSLARAVLVRFLSPEDLFAYLVTGTV
jgi:hypothetical protein